MPPQPHSQSGECPCALQGMPNDSPFGLVEMPNAQVQGRPLGVAEASTGGGVPCNAQLGWWQWAECAASEPAHEAQAWCARCAAAAALDVNRAITPPFAYGVSHALTNASI